MKMSDKAAFGLMDYELSRAADPRRTSHTNSYTITWTPNIIIEFCLVRLLSKSK